MDPERQLTLATIGLVIATALLVIATAIPAIQKWQDRRLRRKATAATVIPDMNMLHSRLDGAVSRLVRGFQLDAHSIRVLIRDVKGQQRIVSEIIDHSYAVSLRFANEVYLVRHFLTQARIQYTDALESVDQETSDIEAARGHINIACVNLKAADQTLLAAEGLLPKDGRLIDGQTFWERFDSLGESRQVEAEKALVDIRALDNPGR